MHQDFKELLSAFNAGQVRYLIVGGYAVSFHAQPRATKDLDILIGADAENSKAVFAALAKFGAPIEEMSAKDFAEPDNFFRMGTPPVMVDIMPKISGVEFEEAWRRREEIRAKGREDWLRLRRQHTQENSRDPQDHSAERDQEAKPKDLSESPDKRLDDDLN